MKDHPKQRDKMNRQNNRAPTKEEFNFVIGRQEKSGYIGVYAYGTEVHFGTIVEARKALECLKKISESKSEAKKYKIYRIDPTPVE